MSEHGTARPTSRTRHAQTADAGPGGRRSRASRPRSRARAVDAPAAHGTDRPAAPTGAADAPGHQPTSSSRRQPRTRASRGRRRLRTRATAGARPLPGAVRRFQPRRSPAPRPAGRPGRLRIGVAGLVAGALIGGGAGAGVVA